MPLRLPGSLSSRLLLLTGSILVITALVVGGLSYVLAIRNAERASLASLSAQATARQTALQQELGHYREDLELEFLHSGLRFAIVDALGSEGDLDGLREALVRECHGPSGAQVVDVVDDSGVIRVSSRRDREGTSVRDDVAHQQGMIGTSLVDLTLDEDRYQVRLAGPILVDDDEILAVVIVAVGAGKVLALLGDYTGLGDTGETVLGRRRLDSIEFLAPLRFAPDIRDLPTVPTSGETARPMIHATAGQSGMIRARDYRDAPVVAAYRPLADSNWGLVVKQDEDEVFAGVRQLGGLLSMVMVGLLVLGFLLILPFVRGVIRPIQALAGAADQVAEGRLDVQVPVAGGDEVTRLAVSFNRMVRRVRDSRDGLTRANEDLERQARELAEVHGELELYTYAVTHDLRTPLVSIRGMVELLVEELGADAAGDTLTYLEHIDESSRRADRLMADLVTLYQAGRVDSTPETVDTAALVRRVADEVRAAHPESSPVVTVTSDLPVVETDRARLHRVLANLLDNAFKYGNGGRGAPVEVGHSAGTSEGGEARHVFFVRDRGPGIPLRDRGRVFDLFFRRADTEVPGTGMGLTVVRRIVRTLGGEAWIESETGEGTTVFFSLPAGAVQWDQDGSTDR